MHIYSLNQQEQDLASQAAAMAREVGLRYAAEVDAHARFPEEAVTVLAEQGFSACASREN